MGMSSLRSLLLAAIFLSNYITWTACRHHYTHNVNGHRSRHRRQGAGLFLPDSYIIPGGEGSGAWGKWGDLSACSRTCGGGVASRKRICLEFGSDGQPLCTGGDTLYFSCQTQDCPEGSEDFRAEQCASYDDKTFRDQKYNWVPYTKAQNPCELNCMPRGERFYYRQQRKVIDGTRCNDESFDVCVDGVCQPVGCDMMLGSNSREDKCRRCRGNGTNCYTAKGVLDSQDYRKGYNDILLIPEGATNILIEEVRESNNYLALRAKLDNVYYLNGHYHIDFPRRLRIAGALWYYERSQQGLAAPDKLRCLGPISEPLYLSLLLQDDNVGVQYEYSVPSALAPPPSQQYMWVHDEYSPCSATCGGGIQTRRVSCRSREELQTVEDALCEAALRPATNESCNTEACAPQWVRGDWGPCSRPCGPGGTRSRQVYCEKVISNGYPSVVADKECFDLLGPKPELYEECNTNATCPTWFTEPWKPCDKLCGEGKQTRLVVCHQRINGRVEIYNDDVCTDEKPETEKSCILHPCDGVDWVLSDWKGCDTCLSKERTRTGFCATKDRKVVAPELCSYHPTPVLNEPCDSAALPPCQYLWYATQWDKCSAECGNGTQTRRVFCGRFDGVTVAAVEDERCDADEKYKDTKPCFVPTELCPARWFAGPWEACTKECGGGEQHRSLMCLSGGRQVLDCDDLTVLDTTQSCNTQPCNGDEVLPVDSKSAPIVDDYDEQECEPESDEYPEENIEVDPEEEVKDGLFTLIPDFITSESTTAIEGSGWDDMTTDTSYYGSGYSTFSTDSDSSTTESSGSTETTLEYTTSDSTIVTGSESIDVTSSTESASTYSTDTTISGEGTSVSGSTETTESEASSSTSATDITSSDLSTFTGSSVILESTTELTGSTTEGSTETSTEVTGNDYSSSESTETTETETKTDNTDVTTAGSSESTITELTDTTESSITTESSMTSDAEGSTTEGSTMTATTESTEISETSSTSVTESDASTASTDISTTISGSTESPESDSTTVSTITESESSTSESVVTESSTLESGATESGTKESDTTESGTTESDTMESSTTESGTSESGTTESGTTESGTTESGTTESGTAASGSTEAGTTEPGTTESGTTEFSSAGSSTTESSTTEFGTTESDDLLESTTSISTESSTSGSETTVSNTSEGSTTESSSSQSSSESSTISEVSESTETSSSEVSTFSTTELSEPTTASGETTSSDISESTTIGVSTVEISTEGAEDTTPWGWPTIVTPKKPPCKARKVAKCAKSKFGCCPDKRTFATGPFDQGCPLPETCAESTYGCCPDGVSAAAGAGGRGCPTLPCAATLYGCCLSDNVTAAEGNDQEGCPEPPPPCFFTKYHCCPDNITEAKGPKMEGCEQEVTETERPKTTEGTGCEVSEFGCCYDGETEATGPDSQGCPCSITEFGCCSDGIAISRGPNLEGCVMTCQTSAYGCCPDGETPAHGPDDEGCCLQTPYGCCPDNYKAAEGPHLEGCGCQHARFGCCPDNITIARGPDREGCGCQHTPHGCCPDRHTAAEGPDFRGCTCNTYQFGCCPDGVTIATGLDQQGCLCQYSEFGCCGDEVTHATGPDMQGCNCASSKYGCCPDGVTEAKGKNFLNCTDVLDQRQAACGLSSDRGSCHNYTVYWYYDVTYGGCSRFWYSGCEGNGNRFVSQAECEDICVHPAPKDTCQLPKVKGACTGYNVRWYYDASREQCSQFVYGGCLGNDNNFETRELCQQRCEPEKTEDQCNLPVEAGPCAGHFPRWAYSGDRKCEQFTWGGCGGNANRFSSEAACLLRCAPPGQPIQACSLPQVAGNCTEKHPAWSFSFPENRCVPFYYTGCGGNDNRFDSEQLCSEICPAAHEQEKCTLPAVTGECAEYSSRYFYDTSVKRCRQFYYGGCGGNENNFVSERECEDACMESEEPITLPAPTTQPPTPASTERVTQPSTQPPTQMPIQTTTHGALPDFCLLDIDQGPCTEPVTRWAYSTASKVCVTFEYGGCGGNRNNFPSEKYCTHYCPSSLAPEPEPKPKPEVNSRVAADICNLPMISGPCDQSLMQWFYDATRDACSQFTYSGCEGNENRFDSQEQCEELCKSSPEANVTSTTTLAPEPIPSECQISSELEECTEEGVVWFLSPEKGECRLQENKKSGRKCRYTGTFATEEACERACGAFRGLDVCRYTMDPGPCRAAIPKVYYNSVNRRCETFTYGGCLGAPNRFTTTAECEQICQPDNLVSVDPCVLPAEIGNCLASISMWYYDAARDECDIFIYGGCNGNDNRFTSRDMCESRCKKVSTTTIAFALSTVTTTTTSAPVITTHQTVVDEECSTPESLAPCGENVTAFYFDSVEQACRRADTGACRRRNNYRTEEECERRCGAFRGLDVCGSSLDAGPCLAAIPKYYWDALSGRCLAFAYGGCEGGPNRFSSIDECEELCRNTGPAPACLLAVATGDARCEAAAGATGAAGAGARRWYYSAAVGDCLPFVFRGCGGNDNNFASYADCAALCIPLDVGSNEVLPDCDRYVSECAALRCEYGVQRTRTAAGCERCACVPVDVDCAPLRSECERLTCNYGVRRVTGTDGCERCTCFEHPCAGTQCADNERCVASPYRDALTMEVRYSTECRIVNKTGVCPAEDSVALSEGQCRRECNDDADCLGVGKCCARGCSSLCVEPAPPATPAPPAPDAPTVAPSAPSDVVRPPDMPQAPRADAVATEPEVRAKEGGKATLRCLFHGNPPPAITWRWGAITIESDTGRYRLLADGSLEIVSLYRNDSGVYICIATNELGSATQEIRLEVDGPVDTKAGIAGESNAVVMGELGKPLSVRCLSYGYPPPAIYWYHGRDGPMVPYSSPLYEARDNVLQIRKLSPDTLGEYICQAYNGIDTPAEWSVIIQAFSTDDVEEHPYLVPRYGQPLTTVAEPTTEGSTTPEPRIEIPVFTVPVSTRIVSERTRVLAGSEINLPCEVDGYPLPTVHWTRDGVPLRSEDRITVTEARLTIMRAQSNDSGVYGCHAANAYSSHYSTIAINVEGLYIPPNCKDNPYFATCNLIVKSKFCHHKYYSGFCCKSCVEAGQLDPNDLIMQADMWTWK